MPTPENLKIVEAHTEADCGNISELMVRRSQLLGEITPLLKSINAWYESVQARLIPLPNSTTKSEVKIVRLDPEAKETVLKQVQELTKLSDQLLTLEENLALLRQKDQLHPPFKAEEQQSGTFYALLQKTLPFFKFMLRTTRRNELEIEENSDEITQARNAEYQMDLLGTSFAFKKGGIIHVEVRKLEQALFALKQERLF